MLSILLVAAHRMEMGDLEKGGDDHVVSDMVMVTVLATILATGP